MPRLSLSALRNLILLALALGVSAYASSMFAFSNRLTQRFVPEVRADLEWRVLRGAQELAHACDVGLVLADADMLHKCFGAYAAASDVQAIIATDPSGKPIAQHGTPPEPVAQLFSGSEQKLRATPGYLVSWASATVEGTSVGRIALVVSTRRLADAHAVLARASNVTLFGGAVMFLLGAIVVTLFTRAVSQRDAQLSEYAANLERKVEARTRELDERNRGMRLVLDNVAQGLVTIDLSGGLASERSAVVDRWFGVPQPGMTLPQYLAPRAPEFAESFANNLTQVADGVLMLELSLDQMPKRFSVAGRTFDVLYTPVGSGDKLEKLLVIFNDVTEQLARERVEREQKELMAIFQRILIDRTGVEEFLTEAKKLVTSLETEEEPVVQWRVVHTLKGNSAMYGLGSLAELAHQIETQMAENDARLNDTQRAELSRAWHDAISRVQELLGGLRKDRVELERRELFAVMERVRAGAPANELLRELETWLDDPVERRLEQLGRQASSLARRLGKAEPEVIIQAGGVRVGGPEWSSYWSAMVHAVRNAVDHGLEPAPARSAAGKPAAGRITLGARRTANELVIWLEDDGRGIDWDKVRVAAARSARPNKTHAELVDALFTDGFTMRQQVSEISGRGVGLAALRQAVHELHGSIEVDSTLGRGTIFRFTFDESRFVRQRVA